MSQRRDVSPGTLPVHVEDDGVVVEYLDGRQVRYDRPIEPVKGSVRCSPGKEVHVLVTEADRDRGVMIYVNDRNTDGEILEETGVGRVVLEPDEESELLPGVVAFLDGHVVEVVADPSVAGGRVFVFEEDELGEQAFELEAA
jgi:hypothetical protein